MDNDLLQMLDEIVQVARSQGRYEVIIWLITHGYPDIATKYLDYKEGQ